MKLGKINVCGSLNIIQKKIYYKIFWLMTAEELSLKKMLTIKTEENQDVEFFSIPITSLKKKQFLKLWKVNSKNLLRYLFFNKFLEQNSITGLKHPSHLLYFTSYDLW